MKKISVFVCLLLLAGIATVGQGAITNVAFYELGEPGSYSGTSGVNSSMLPLDSTGNTAHDLDGAWDQGASLTAIAFTGGDPAPAPLASAGSTHYTRLDMSYRWGADLSDLPTDNWALEVWFRSTDDFGSLFESAGNEVGTRLKVKIEAGGMISASYDGAAWIGPAGGVAGYTDGAWHHLAVIRDNSTSTLYLDGLAQAGTTAIAPFWGTNAQIGTQDGAFGLTPYTGDMDYLRVFTFDPLTDDPVAALTVPEPTTIGLLTLGAFGLLRRRRVS